MLVERRVSLGSTRFERSCTRWNDWMDDVGSNLTSGFWVQNLCSLSLQPNFHCYTVSFAGGKP